MVAAHVLLAHRAASVRWTQRHVARARLRPTARALRALRALTGHTSLALVPRNALSAGQATNVRPAQAHGSRRRATRARTFLTTGAHSPIRAIASHVPLAAGALVVGWRLGSAARARSPTAQAARSAPNAPGAPTRTQRAQRRASHAVPLTRASRVRPTRCRPSVTPAPTTT